MMSTETVLNDIIETLEDGRKGFEAGAEKLAEDGRPDLAETFRQYSEQRGRFSVELRMLASRHGIEIDESGSISGALHRGWMTLKDALAGDDPSGVLDAAEQGEDHAVSEYAKALDPDKGIPADVRNVLVRQFNDVRVAHDEVRSLRNRANG